MKSFTSRTLHFQHTFLPSRILLKCVHERCRYREYSPLAIGWGVCSWSGGRWRADNGLITFRYGRPVRGQVQSSHGLGILLHELYTNREVAQRVQALGNWVPRKSTGYDYRGCEDVV